MRAALLVSLLLIAPPVLVPVSNATAQSATPTPLAPYPRHDGFIYPGQPGSRGIAPYIDRWNRFNRARPKPGPSRWADEVAWMTGDWNVQLRDFTVSNERTGMMLFPPGRATIAFTPQKRWLKFDVVEPRRYALRLLGYDPEQRRWVWRDIFTPGVGDRGPSFAAGWSHGRLRFGAKIVDFHGLLDPDRITLVKETDDRFRIVSEVRTESGNWVAADDYVYTRRPARITRGDRGA